MLILIGVIFLLLLGNGFFSGSEIAVISIRRSKIEELVASGRRSALRLKHLHESLEDFLATVQIGVTLTGTLAGVIGGGPAPPEPARGRARAGAAHPGAPAPPAAAPVGPRVRHVV